MTTTNSIITLYQPSFLSPYLTSVDLQQPTIFSCVVNGNQVDSYEVIIKDINNNLLYDSSPSTTVQANSSNVSYSGSGWTTNFSQIVDDIDTNISYGGSGWNVLTSTDNSYFRNSVHYSNNAGDYFQYEFYGTGLNLYMTTNNDHGIANIYIDDTFMTAVDTYSALIVYHDLIYSVTNLTYGLHTIKVIVTGTQNPSAVNCRVELDYMEILNSGNIKGSNNANDYITLSFNGTGVIVNFEDGTDLGIANIYIDNMSMGNTDLYITNNYTNLSLNDGWHTIKIIVTGNKNDSSSNSYIILNNIQSLTKTSLSSILYDGDTFLYTLPANTITQKGALKWQLKLWNSNNNNEVITSGENIFTNMSTPNLVITSTGNNSKSNTFGATYTQAENIQIMKYNYTIYGFNYEVYCGKFGQQVNGTQIYCGQFNDDRSNPRYAINCGSF
ncbi:hypothetical protein [Clostridium sp.]|uniref:hypothetical protein n=1 Tax=Clostridium sp. TaxID=1506 RepID=UPI0026052038|nr:hypothetical protein [Clostridium sp.]